MRFFKARRPFTILFGVLLIACLVWIGGLQIVIWHLESQVWRKKNFEAVQTHAVGLAKIAEHRLTPPYQKVRLLGLAADGFMYSGDTEPGSVAASLCFEIQKKRLGISDEAGTNNSGEICLGFEGNHCYLFKAGHLFPSEHLNYIPSKRGFIFPNAPKMFG